MKELEGQKGGRKIQENAVKDVEVVWTCIEKRRRIRGQECDGGGGDGERTGGRPKRRLLDGIRNDLLERELSGRTRNGGVSYIQLTAQHVQVVNDTEEEDSTICRV